MDPSTVSNGAFRDKIKVTFLNSSGVEIRSEFIPVDAQIAFSGVALRPSSIYLATIQANKMVRNFIIAQTTMKALPMPITMKLIPESANSKQPDDSMSGIPVAWTLLRDASDPRHARINYAFVAPSNSGVFKGILQINFGATDQNRFDIPILAFIQ
jgi:hypothetical protein